MMVKTAHARSPKNWLGEKLKDHPGGTWIVLERRAEEGVPLMAIGYKYNKKKVLTFVGTRVQQTKGNRMKQGSQTNTVMSVFGMLLGHQFSLTTSTIQIV